MLSLLCYLSYMIFCNRLQPAFMGLKRKCSLQFYFHGLRLDTWRSAFGFNKFYSATSLRATTVVCRANVALALSTPRSRPAHDRWSPQTTAHSMQGILAYMINRSTSMSKTMQNLLVFQIFNEMLDDFFISWCFILTFHQCIVYFS